MPDESRPTVDRQPRAVLTQAESSQIYTNIFQYTADGVALANEQAIIVEWNPALEQMTGLKRANALGQSVWDVNARLLPDELKTPARAEQMRAAVQGMLDPAQAPRVMPLHEIQVQRPDGSRADLQASYLTFRTDQGLMLASIVRDLTRQKQMEASLRQSQEFLSDLLENMPASIYVTLADGRVHLLNHTAEQSLGILRERAIGSRLDALFPVDQARTFGETNQRVLEQGEPLAFEEMMGNADERHYYHTVKFPLRNAIGHVDAVGGISIDITERKRAEHALCRHSERLELLRQMDQAILENRPLSETAATALRELRRLVPSRRASVITLDETAYEMLIVAADGDSTANVPLGQRFVIQHHSEYAELFDRLRQGKPYLVSSTCELRALFSTRLFPEESNCYLNVPLIARDKLFGVLCLSAADPNGFAAEHLQIVREVADEIAVAIRSRDLLDQVRVGRERMKMLSRQLVTAQESERREIARELHDQVGQSLSTLSATLSIAGSQLAPALFPDVTRRLQDAQRLVEETVGCVRQLMSELRPPVLDDYGLAAALRWYGTQFAERTGIAVQLSAQDPSPRLPVTTEITLFRIAQEALTNVARHASATQVTIKLEATDGDTRLTIADNGKGFDSDLHHRCMARPEWGIINMRERADAVNGNFTIQTAPGRGTTIVVTVPR